ncbi:Tm-1-like ATP-binding domain-containing protein [Streptosporangium lutulentum]
MDSPGLAFHDPKADQACFEAVREGLRGSAVRVEELDLHVNDPGFGRAMADRLHLMISSGGAG